MSTEIGMRVPVTESQVRSLAAVAAIQGLVYLCTGIWPLIHIDSFLAVTGPKTDLWLVYTVGVIVTVVGVALLMALWNGRITPEVILLAIGTALGLAAIDIVFVLRGTIDSIYLADAAMELLISFWWVAAVRRDGSDRHELTSSK